MTLKEMQYLVAIARHGNLTKAANELYITQPTLSKFIAAEEASLGTNLFKRVNNNYIPTYVGQVYIENAQKILNLNDSFETQIAEMLDKHIDHISVGFTSMRVALVLPSVLPAFKKKYPNIDVNIMVMHSAELEERILNGTLDIAFITTDTFKKEFNYEIIYSEDFLLAAPPDFHSSTATNLYNATPYPWIDLREIADQPFIFQPSRTRNRLYCERLLEQAHIQPNVVLELSNVIACLGLVASGYGFSFVSESLIPTTRVSDRQPQFFSVGSPLLTTSFCAIYRSNSYLKSYAHEFIEFVKMHQK